MQTAFRGRTLGLRESADEGIADVMVAVFDIPDTNPAVGNSARQVIDKGAFRGWIDATDFAENPVPMFIDHGDAMITGFATAAKKVGYADNFRESEDGLVYTSHYNLGTQRGREAWSDLKFDPAGTKFSFRWPPNEDLYDGDDGFEHVRSFTSVMEVSQVGFGAQMQAGVMATTMRSGEEEFVLRPHTTDTTQGFWNEKQELEKLSEEPEAIRSMYAWAAEEKFSYPHHIVNEDGTVGAASVSASRATLDLLSIGGLITEDEHGAYSHVAQHLVDAGETFEDLRASDTTLELGGDGDTIVEVDSITDNNEMVAHMMVGHSLALPNDATDADLLERHAAAHAEGVMSIPHEEADVILRTAEDEVAAREEEETPIPSSAVVTDWMKQEEFRNQVLQGLARYTLATSANEGDDDDEEAGGSIVDVPSGPEASAEETTIESAEQAEPPTQFHPLLLAPVDPNSINWTSGPTGNWNSTSGVTWDLSALGTTTGASRAAAVSLDTTSMAVNEAFMAAYEGWWVKDVFMEPGMAAGFVVACDWADEAMQPMKIPFVVSDGEYTFNIDKSEPVSKEWVDAKGKLLRAWLESDAFMHVIKELGEETGAKVRTAVEEAFSPDPTLAFYRHLNSRRQSAQ